MFSKEREKEGEVLAGWRSEANLVGYEAGKTVVRIYCVKKYLFPILKTKNETEMTTIRVQLWLPVSARKVVLLEVQL